MYTVIKICGVTNPVFYAGTFYVISLNSIFQTVTKRKLNTIYFWCCCLKLLVIETSTIANDTLHILGGHVQLWSFFEPVVYPMPIQYYDDVCRCSIVHLIAVPKMRFFLEFEIWIL